MFNYQKIRALQSKLDATERKRDEYSKEVNDLIDLIKRFLRAEPAEFVPGIGVSLGSRYPKWEFAGIVEGMEAKQKEQEEMTVLRSRITKIQETSGNMGVKECLSCHVPIFDTKNDYINCDGSFHVCAINENPGPR